MRTQHGALTKAMSAPSGVRVGLREASTAIQTIISASIAPAITIAATAIPRLSERRSASAPRTTVAIAGGNPNTNPPPGRSQASVEPGTDSSASASLTPGLSRVILAVEGQAG